MPRPKKQTYEWVPKLKKFRKRLKDADGKWVAIYGNTEAELAGKIRDAEAIIAAGLEMRRDPTVEQYAAEWLLLIRPTMSARHYESMEQCVRLRIVPAIGDLFLRDVKANDCQLVLNRMAGMSKSLHSKTLSAMRQIFENAIDNHIIAKNPCANLSPGGKPAEEKTALTAEQKKVLLETVAGTRAETFVMLGLYAGLRREEILGLTWDHVDLKSDVPSLKVCQAVKWQNNQPIVDTKLKTKAAYRTIPLPRALVDHLSGLPEKKGFVVGGTPLTENQFRNLWAKVERCQIGQGRWKNRETKETISFAKELGQKSRGGHFYYTIDFDVTPHILRHTYITDLILAGANPRRVQYLAGHSNIRTTMNIYTHLVEHAPINLASEIEKAFGK